MKTLTSQLRIDLKNILFATDFSPASMTALPYAAGIARHYEANFYALHVRMPLSPEALPVVEKAATDDEQAGMRMLRESTAGVAPVILVEEGPLWPTIESAVKKNKIDLIVAGTRGRTGIGKLLLGSAAEEIVRNASCPVLTVGPHAASHPRAGGFTEILYATDFSSEFGASAAFAISLAQEYEALLTLLHVIDSPKTGELVLAEELIPAAERRLRELVSPEAQIWCKPQYLVDQGDPAEKILDVAERRKADLIILGVRHSAGIPGAATHLPIATVHKIVAHAKCPVLTVRTETPP
jgi:nucleotide-binding universal stress UspA family protein